MSPGFTCAKKQEHEGNLANKTSFQKGMKRGWKDNSVVKRAYAIPQDMSSVLSVHIGSSRLLGPPVPGDPMFSSDLLEHNHTHGIQSHRNIHF